ncbi:MAG TPA: HNH nuclease family protein [Gammaproteobacteria bacterium]|nr:HNH nuclease family protein [Gammaproteobacteria bacterium]
MDNEKLDRVVAKARKDAETRGHGYREQALKLYPWICGRCCREFTRVNLQELTVHHINHDHDDNPTDGSNWELLCLYCHDNEHQRYTEQLADHGIVLGENKQEEATNQPFADLASLLKKD